MIWHAKVNKKVHEALGFQAGDRYRLKDGSYIVWQADLVRLGSMLGIGFQSDVESYLRTVCAQVGGVLITMAEAREEQDATNIHTLPEAEDIRFRLDTVNTSPASGGSLAEEENADGSQESDKDSTSKENIAPEENPDEDPVNEESVNEESVNEDPVNEDSVSDETDKEEDAV